MPPENPYVTLELPPEFVALCEADNVLPERVLRGFIADLAGIECWESSTGPYFNNGSDERRLAMGYYDRAGHSWPRLQAEAAPQR